MNNNSKKLNKDNSAKHWLKLGRWRARRLVAAARWGPRTLASAPAVLGNAMPKSGSHLIIQVLQGLTEIGPFVNPGFPPVNRAEDNQPFSDKTILENLARMKPGDIGYGYIKAKEEFIQALTRPGISSVFVYRDPRDMIVSHVFYATEMYTNHGMHQYYTETLSTMEARINAAIGGVIESGFELRSVKSRYDAYKDWLAQPGILSLRFEDLRLDRDKAFDRILDYLEGKGFQLEIERQKAIEIMGKAIAPQKSGTFRKGKPGGWREHFTRKNVNFFKESAGDLLTELGYEEDNEWSLDRKE